MRAGTPTGGMGMSKHRKSGESTKGSRTRLLMRLDAERDERKPRLYRGQLFASVAALFAASRRHR